MYKTGSSRADATDKLGFEVAVEMLLAVPVDVVVPVIDVVDVVDVEGGTFKGDLEREKNPLSPLDDRVDRADEEEFEAEDAEIVEGIFELE